MCFFIFCLLFVCLFVWLSLHLIVKCLLMKCLLVCLCICFYMYVYLFVSLLDCLFVYAYNNKAFICLFICLSFVCLFVWLSLHLIMKRLPVCLFSFWLFAQWWSLCLKIKCIFMGVFVCLFSSFSFFLFYYCIYF